MGMGSLADREILSELGRRLRAHRIQADLSQRDLARLAGVSLRTLQSAESGGDAQMSTLLRLLRPLGRLDGLEALLPEPRISPMQLLKTQGHVRQRVRRARAAGRPRG